VGLIAGAIFGGRIENKITKSSFGKSITNKTVINWGKKLKGKFALICAGLIGLQSFKGFFTDVIGFGKENPLE